MASKPQSRFIRLKEARELSLVRTGQTFDSELVRLVMDGDLELFGRFCPDVTTADPQHGEIELIETGVISGRTWDWERNSITVIRLVETGRFPEHEFLGFGDVSFSRSEFADLLEKLARMHTPQKRRGPKTKYDPELVTRIIEIEDYPRGSKSQGDLARALLDDPQLKRLGLDEPYAEKLVRKFRDT